MRKQIVYIIQGILKAVFLVCADFKALGTAVREKSKLLCGKVDTKFHARIGGHGGENPLKEGLADLHRKHETVELIVAVYIREELDTTALKP